MQNAKCKVLELRCDYRLPPSVALRQLPLKGGAQFSLPPTRGRWQNEVLTEGGAKEPDKLQFVKLLKL